MKSPFIRTVLGDVDTADMGITYSHEHIIIEESYPTEKNPEFVLNDTGKVTAELQELYQAGCRTMVDTMPSNCGRNVEKLAEVSRRSNIHIIAPTGIHLEMYYPTNHWRFHYSEQQLANLFIADIEEGIDRHDYGGPIVERTRHRAGMIKLATGDGNINKHQEKIFGAVTAAHLQTGAPILTHTNQGTLALEQVELFEKLGADLDHVVISHVDRNYDLQYHRDLLQSGVFVEYDSAFRWKGENHTYWLLENLLPEFRSQITMGMDAAKNVYWRSYGGKPGLDFLLTTFVQDLQKMGLSEFFDDIFLLNPARLYAFKI
ncbi:MAG: aryldialkylphosphatase [Cyclobacteriaceae bacterium]|nr:aryldialkylphosphatase [Cyclobacteriaceae bacterium]